jgi:hypothetical protein
MNSNLNADFKTIFELDLDPIKAKLMHKESGEGWSPEQVDAVEVEYRRFLSLMKLFPHEQVAPLVTVDIFWHYHILDTMKYAADCDQIFGYFLHHVPSSGSVGEDEVAKHHRTGARMQELYETTFGEAYIRLEQGKVVTTRAQPAAAKTAWCAPETAKTAWCAPEAAKTAWCAPETLKTAWCAPATAITAWCAPATPKAAWCALAAAKTAWCAPEIAKTAWCAPATAKIAWCAPATAMAARPHPAAPNDTSYSHQALAMAA